MALGKDAVCNYVTRIDLLRANVLQDEAVADTQALRVDDMKPACKAQGLQVSGKHQALKSKPAANLANMLHMLLSSGLQSMVP